MHTFGGVCCDGEKRSRKVAKRPNTSHRRSGGVRKRLHDGMMASKAARVEKLGYWDLGHRDGDADIQVRRGTIERTHFRG